MSDSLAPLSSMVLGFLLPQWGQQGFFMPVYSQGARRSNDDELLGGGLRTGQLTEIVGDACAGKTQLCLTVAAHFCAFHRTDVVWISSGADLAAQRLLQIAQMHVNDAIGVEEVWLWARPM